MIDHATQAMAHRLNDADVEGTVTANASDFTSLDMAQAPAEDTVSVAADFIGVAGEEGTVAAKTPDSTPCDVVQSPAEGAVSDTADGKPEKQMGSSDKGIAEGKQRRTWSQQEWDEWREEKSFLWVRQQCQWTVEGEWLLL